MSEPQVKKRIRKRSIAIQMELALRDAEAAATADIATKKLIQMRLNILSKALARERNDKLRKALTQVEFLSAENEKLSKELAAKPVIARPDESINITQSAFRL